MPSVTIRDLPKETHAELTERAQVAGKSLQEYLRSELIRLAELPDAQTWVERVRRRKATMESSVTTEKILKYRDAGRR
jgi:hypothetical protein